jgi:hypothetical protein
MLGVGLAAEVLATVLRLSMRAATLPVRPMRAVANDADTPWWKKPGLAIMYQIESRPGWGWDRDYDAFNASLIDSDGNFSFKGRPCRIDEWMELSKKACVDYHSFQAKWHDGICWFRTTSTKWKTDKDHAGDFAGESRKAGIPFLYYYSSLFDHNPRFDSIQPDRHTTLSFIGRAEGNAYLDYLEHHYDEIMGRYEPDGMWLDWYWPGDRTSDRSIEFLKRRYPHVPIVFNMSNLFSGSYGRIDFSSGEAHVLDGPFLEFSGEFIVFKSAWKWANLNRRLFDHPWELCTPAGKWWQDPTLRDDPLDLLRMAAIVLACGGKLHIGSTVLADGTVHPDQQEQLGLLGAWYGPRKALFRRGRALGYRGSAPPGATVSCGQTRIVATAFEDGYLLHLINMRGGRRDLTIRLKGGMWRNGSRAHLKPSGRVPEFRRNSDEITVRIPAGEIDPVDTILFVRP